jgi:hypothetical protein
MQPLRTKHRPWIALTAMLLIGGSLTAACGADAKPAPPAAGFEARSGAMNTPVSVDGALEYTLTSLDCDAVSIPGATPHGHYCVLAIKVRNLSDTAREPGIAFAKAYDPRGAAYLADAFAEIRAGTMLLDQLAPKATLADRLIYDVPAGTAVTSVVLGGSVTVPVS